VGDDEHGIEHRRVVRGQDEAARFAAQGIEGIGIEAHQAQALGAGPAAAVDEGDDRASDARGCSSRQKEREGAGDTAQEQQGPAQLPEDEAEP
jgi:hypothetical protein